MGVNRQVKRRAVFLDRDGVINRARVVEGKPYPPASLNELEILPGVSDGLAALKSAGFLLVVVTNQPDVARGTTTKALVDEMNSQLKSELELDLMATCFHQDADDCSCRKPKPGLLLEAARALDIDLTSSYMVGDRWRDMQAGKDAGCMTFFLDYGYLEKQPEHFDYCVTSLKEAAQKIVSM
jgi:D-glycero-D-manno-heptose 1,7-bisphosphate phosphatase